MKLSLTVLIFLSVCIAKGQTNPIDEKYGFERFKLESPYSIEKNNLRLMFEAHEGGTWLKEYKESKIKRYEYKKKDVTNVFGVPTNRLVLKYYQDKLYEINIFFLDTFSKEDSSIIAGKLNELCPNNQAKFAKGELWEGKKVLLYLTYYQDPFLRKAVGTYLSIRSKAMNSKRIQDSF